MRPDPRDTLDLSSGTGPGASGHDSLVPDGPAHATPGRVTGHGATDRAAPATGKSFLSLYFSCSNQYSRASRNAAGTAYQGSCPSCGRCVRFAIGPGGTSERFFTISCV